MNVSGMRFVADFVGGPYDGERLELIGEVSQLTVTISGKTHSYRYAPIPKSYGDGLVYVDTKITHEEAQQNLLFPF